jgi:hypothetical protein
MSVDSICQPSGATCHVELDDALVDTTLDAPLPTSPDGTVLSFGSPGGFLLQTSVADAARQMATPTT